MFIDVHLHVGRMTDIDAEATAVSQFMAAADIQAAFVSNIQAAKLGMFAQDVDETEANLAALRAIETHQNMHALYWARPGCPDSHPQATLGGLSQEPFYGVLLAPRMGDYAADDVRVDPYVQIASRFRLPVLVLSSRDEQSRPKRVYNLARRFPRHPFVILNADADAHWREAVDCVQKSVAGRDANLFLETAHIPFDEISVALRVIKPDRVLFGSDFDGSNPQEAAIEQARQLSERLGAAAASIMSDNAFQLFELSTARAS